MAHIPIDIGGVQAWLLDCGSFRYDGGVIFGAVPRISWQRYYEPDEDHRVAVALRPLLVAHTGGYVLVDTGLIAPHSSVASQYPDALPITEALSDFAISPEAVTHVLLTHLHPDHVAGNFWHGEEGLIPTFPNARYLVQRDEAAAAAYPNERTRTDYEASGLGDLVQQGVVDVVHGRVKVCEGIWLVPAPGHTPGHQCVLISANGESALYVSDLAIVPVQAERLAWISALDTHPMTSLESKREVLGRAVEDRSLILFEHEPDDALATGYLRPDGKRWRFQPRGG